MGDRLSERLRLDSNGNVAAQGGHLPFGEDFAETGGVEKHHFTSYERDNETGADYAVNRLYSSGVGRFTAVDRLSSSAKPGRPQTLNRYTYSSGDPVNLVDPTGLDAFSSGAGGGVDESNPCPDGFYYIGTFLTDAGEETDCGYDPVPGGGDSGGDSAPQQCRLRVNLSGPKHANISILSSHHDHDVSQLGAGTSTGSDGSFWFFLFEIQVQLPSDDQDPADWVPSQYEIKTGSDTILVNGQHIPLPYNLQGDDSPNANAVDASQAGFIYWLDAPDVAMTDTDVTAGSGPVVAANVNRIFNFSLKNIKDPSRSCNGFLGLRFTLNEGGKPHWSTVAFGTP